MRVSGTTHEHHRKLKPCVCDELMQLINMQMKSMIADPEYFENLDGLDELVQHSITGLIEIKQKKLPKIEEIEGCRQHLENLKSTMNYMSNISTMTEMSLLMSALGQILNVASQRLGEIERKNYH